MRLLLAVLAGSALAMDPRSLRPPLSYTGGFAGAATQPISLTPIGVVESPYLERFGTPRQPTHTELTAGGGRRDGAVVLHDPQLRSALRDLDGFSHCWVIAYMHLNTGWKPLVQPPRGPRRRRGLFATRAPHRPCALSLSALEITAVDESAGRVSVRGLDLLDGTPVLDIKPYVPYADAFPHASAGWIDELEGSPTGPDRLEYWPPPPHLTAEVVEEQ